MKPLRNSSALLLLFFIPFSGTSGCADPARTPNIQAKAIKDLLTIDNGTIKIGIDREMGASLTWLSWTEHPKNVINIHDPGRLIQQSYYAGKQLDRSADGQSKAWNPWPWNPIQGGGVGSWATVNEFKIIEGSEDKDKAQTLFGETIPKLWDMPNEDADAIMRQWTGFEPDMPDVVVVRCELICKRDPKDRWGPAVARHQEVPACYFTRNFSKFASYLGEGKWRAESQAPGPPWGKATPPRKAMGCFNAEGNGIAIFSPCATEHWNFGPHGGGNSSESNDAPCVHLAPIAKAKIGPKSSLTYRYWMIVGTESSIAKRLDVLWEKYSRKVSLEVGYE